MKGVDVRQKKALSTKTTFSAFFMGKDTGFLAKERFKTGTIKWYPFYIRDNKISPKYSNIKYIGTKNGKIPKAGFSTTAATGYGFTSSQGVSQFFQFIDRNITSIKSVIFVEGSTKLTSKGVLELSFRDFVKIRNRAKMFHSSKKDEEDKLIRRTLNEIGPSLVKEPGKLIYFPNTINRYLLNYAEDSIRFSDEDITSVRSALINSGLSTEIVLSTKKEIDKIYIEDVLEEYKSLLSLGKGAKNLEEKWHTFFRRHTWIFSQIFAYPAVFIKDKFNVGGHDLSDNTDKIVDFLYKNKLTNSVSFIEIKTHKTELINGRTPYRKPDIYPVSNPLSGAIIQVLDQRMRFLKSFHSLKGEGAVDALNTSCLVIIGNYGDLKNKHTKDSFELFRSSNREVNIVTFDELLDKINTLLEVFAK